MSASMQCPIFSILLVLGMLGSAAGSEFLVQRPDGYEAKVKAETIRTDLQRAMAETMGNGHGVGHERLVQAREVLSRLFLALPKNSYGRIERPMLRYALHRYFAQRYSITVKGLEPAKNASNNHHSVGAEILLDQVPAYAEAVLEGRFSKHGFGLDDVVVMAATLEQLVLGSGAQGLETAYKLRNKAADTALTRTTLEEVLETYVLLWLVGEGADISATNVTFDRQAIEESLPQWGEVTEFARGEVDRHEHQARQTGGNPFRSQYYFDDAQRVVSQITAGFGHWWEQECQSIKKNLMKLAPEGSGRVPLSAFYRASMEGEWRFGESEAYLRELGHLDDTSYWKGPQVIMPNYLQGTSNCIIASTYYLVCCVNECEALLQRVEDTVQAPVASVEQILPVVESMLALEEKAKKQQLPKALASQLRRISETHRGQIPLHGRLFTQWMHYVFPQECPFPQKAGTAVARTPEEFGDAYIATPQEMHKHVKKGSRSASQPANLTEEEKLGMSQWLHEEELLTDYAELRPRTLGTTGLALAMALLGLLALLARSHLGAFSEFLPFATGKETGFGSFASKQHLV